MGIILFSTSEIALGASAESSDWIVRAGIIPALVKLEGYTTNGTVGTGQPIPAGPFAGKPDGFLLDENGDDVTATIELGAGREFGPWALLLGYQYRYRTDLDVVAYTASLDRPSQFHCNISTHVVDLNLIRRFEPVWSLRPFLGAGLGLAINTSDSKFIVRELPGVAPETTTHDDTTTTEPSWNVQVGVTKDLGTKWNLELRYRFVTLGKAKNGPYPTSRAEIETGDGIYSHDVLIGVDFRF